MSPCSLEHIRSKEVELVQGPMVHGIEGDGFLGGSGSHAFYFLDPDGNRIEVYWSMMRVTEQGSAAPGEAAPPSELPAVAR
ncbi:MAG: hypothetical protein ACE5JJ_09175 [Nitrospinota bacterium]